MFHEIIATMGPYGAYGIVAGICGLTAVVAGADMIARLRKEDAGLNALTARFAVVSEGSLSPCALLSRLLR